MFTQEQTNQIIQTRHKIVLDYCKEKKWNPASLTIEQIIEIRSTPEWKNVPDNISNIPPIIVGAPCVGKTKGLLESLINRYNGTIYCWREGKPIKKTGKHE